MHSVIETAVYLRHAAAVGLTDEEKAAIVDLVAADPTTGEIMVGTGGARKLRFARRNAVKSGGYRVIIFYAAADIPVFLLDVFGKGDKANLSKAERNDLANLLGQIADAYRTSAETAAKKSKGDVR